jgi:hypothetical protein
LGVQYHAQFAKLIGDRVQPAEEVMWRGAVPSKLYRPVDIDAVGRNSTAGMISVGEIFEISGTFGPKVLEAFRRLEARTEAMGAEICRQELELVCDICTNCADSMTNAQLLRVAEFLLDKYASLESELVLVENKKKGVVL